MKNHFVKKAFSFLILFSIISIAISARGFQINSSGNTNTSNPATNNSSETNTTVQQSQRVIIEENSDIVEDTSCGECANPEPIAATRGFNPYYALLAAGGLALIPIFLLRNSNNNTTPPAGSTGTISPITP